MRLIDADALNKNMFDYAAPEMLWSKDDIQHKIGEMPTIDAVHVVRCGDCKHRTELSPTSWHPCVDMAVNDGWFCADGEMRTE